MEYQSSRDKSDKMMRLVTLSLSVFAGLLIFIVGLVLFKKDHFNIPQVIKFTKDRDTLLLTMFGGICMLYGVWRMYRGYSNFKNS
jgi:uncharacterized membrane protein YgdD (TMEM256/DUF423 family)